MSTKVFERSGAVMKLVPAWNVIEPLMGGTLAMREAGERLLPRFPSEDATAWTRRKDAATLFPALKRTVRVLASKPFSKPITLSDETPPEIVEWANDIDREGVNLHTFAAEMLAEALAYGLAGILVDAPPVAEPGKVQTKAQQQAEGRRPYWVRVRHNQILGWRVEQVEGRTRLTMLRLAEPAEVADGEWGTKIVERVRVLRPGSWEIWEKQEKAAGADGDADWKQIEGGLSGVDEITFVPLYGARKGFMDAESPLVDLAHLNVKHWQKQSDQDNIEHCACVPILVATGFADTDDIAIGAATAIKSSNPDAKVQWCELQGSSIKEGKESLSALEDQMLQCGAELLVKKPGSRTATEDANDAEANKSDLQRITEAFEDALDTALKFTAAYIKKDEGGKVTLFKDFGAALLSDASAQLVLSLQQGGLISKPTAIKELQRRGTLSADIDPEEEAEAIAAEGPALGDMEYDPANPEEKAEPPEPEKEAA